MSNSRENFKIIQTFEGNNYEKSFVKNKTKSEPIVRLDGVSYKSSVIQTDAVTKRDLLFANDKKGYTLGDNGQACSIYFDEELLSKHVALIGGIGTGKTNTFKNLISQISQTLTSDDVMFIFDTKGDFYSEFGDNSDENDLLITNTFCSDKNGNTATSKPEEIWNIFEDLDQEKLYESSNEIASMMFSSHVEKSSNSFFPLAAKSIFASVLRAIKRLNPEILASKPSNKLLKEFFNGKNIFKSFESESGDDFFASKKDDNVLKNIDSLLSFDDHEKGVLSYISTESVRNGNNKPIDGQTLGVLAELHLVIDELFIGNFAKEGSFSISKAFKSKGAKRIFLQYDVVEGSTLSPIYSLLTDLAIKESLSPLNNGKNYNFYFIVDEFKLLPRLKHVDDAVNFGRSLGVKFVIGVQNVSQLIENYGEASAMNILSGFSSVIAYRVSDYATRKYLIELFGVNRKKTTYLSAISSRGVLENLESANVIEDWDISALQVGEAIVRLEKSGLTNNNPFFIKFLPFGHEWDIKNTEEVECCCPNCKNNFEIHVKPDFIGEKKVKCPNCKKSFTVRID